MIKDIIYIAGQIFGIAPVIFGFISFQAKSSRGIIFWQLATALGFSLHYLMIGALTGAALNFLAAIKGVCYYYRDKAGSKSLFFPIFFSALAFGLMHANFYQFFYAFALGLVLGYVYYKTGRIWYSVVLHAAINFVGSVLTSYLSVGVEEMTAALEKFDLSNTEEMVAFLGEYGFWVLAEYAFVAFVLIAMICAVVLPIVFRKRIKLERKVRVSPRKNVLLASFLNAGAIIMLLVYSIQFVLTLVAPLMGNN